MTKTRKRLYIKGIFFLILLILPWSLDSASNDPVMLSQDGVGYYQSNTCEHSLLGFFIQNIDVSNIQYNFDTYSTINCFGKINGVDLVGDTFKVYVGTNLVLDLLYQSLIWLLLISLIQKDNSINNKNPILIPIICSLLFITQYFAENIFYKSYTKNYDGSLALDNFFILSIFLVYFLVFKIIDDIALSREKKLIIYFPFIFLFIGTYSSNNINFYLLLLSYLGIKNFSIFKIKKHFVKFTIFITFLIVWMTGLTSNEYFFDPDKLRGFINSSYTSNSQFFWITILSFSIYGFLQLLNNLKNADWSTIRINFLSAGSFIVIFGYLGARFPIINLLNIYFFGQNKRGMQTLTSIEGNTWRGFSSSAEAVGEYFGFVILFFIIISIYTKKKFAPLEVLMVFINIYGLFKTNNFSASVLLVVFICVLLILEFTYLDKKYILLSILLGITGLFYLKLNSLGYNYISKHLLLEASSYSNLFVGMPDYQNADRFFRENDVGTVLLTSDNEQRMSNSLRLLINLFTQEYNIKFFPNLVALLSFISLVVNRTRLWGIFIAKYNPDISHLLFGYGPLQLNEYYFGHEVVFIDGLILPHSSLLNLLVFFGVLGIIGIFYYLIKFIYSNYKNYGVFLVIFLSINFLKSDSILYLSSILLYIYSIKFTEYSFKDRERESIE